MPKRTSGARKSRSTTRRELNETRGNKRFAKRNADGTFREMDDVKRSLAADRRRNAKRATKSGHGDQGDRARSSKKK